MNSKRELSVDILRGWAIIFMIVGHSIFFRYGLQNGFLNLVLNFGNVFCYITFLFTFGVGLYHSIINPTLDPPRHTKILKRIIALWLMYYAVATVSLWSYYPLRDWHMSLLLGEFWRIFTFNYYPGFTEYIPSFLFFSIITYATRVRMGDKLKKIFTNGSIGTVFFIGLIIHMGANWLAHATTQTPVWLHPLIGAPNSFDFPILQYLPVLLLGIWSASWINGNKKTVSGRIIVLGYIVLLANLALKYSFNFSHALGWIVPWINTPLRWPPSLSFLLSGLSATYFFWIFSRWMGQIKWLAWVVERLNYVGQRSLGLLVYHLLLLFVMKIANLPMFNLWQLTVFLALIPLSYRAGEVGYNKFHEKTWSRFGNHSRL